ncbi:hypothetical protein C8Q80DRAFT_491707 [Daedaleopsis nitida]|nr:hypothetical protein C8Q80DRAFT_491707 [Daedaleopsis nitida]
MALPKQQNGTADGTARRRRHPRPLRRHLKTSLTTCFFLVVAFVLFLLVGLSLPIIKPIYIFEISFEQSADQPVTSVASTLRFGVWGLCAISELGTSSCIQQLGYTIPQEIIDLTGYPDLVDALADGITVLLVLHLVSAGLAFVGACSSLFLESQPMCIISLLASILTLLVALIVFAVDLALALIGMERVGPLTQFNYNVNWGPAVWMVLVAVILTLLGMILMSVVVCGCCGVGRKHHHHHHHHHHHDEERK